MKAEHASIHWFSLQMTSATRSGSGYSQEPETPMCMSGVQGFGLFITAFPDLLAESWIESESGGTLNGHSGMGC